MPTIKYSNNPNSDTAFVIQDGGQKNRTVLIAEPAGTLQLSDSANVSTGYVTDEDGKKHKVNLVAQLEGDIEFSENPNSTKGYVTVDNKKHRVVLTASLHGGGGSPVIDTLNVTPSTIAQQITAPSGTDGYSPVNVSAVTSSIDANIVAGNIKDGVTILGVTGNYQGSGGGQSGWVFPANIVSGALVEPNSFVLAGGITEIGSGGLQNACLEKAAIITADLSSIITISGQSACDTTFYNCSSLESVDLSSLTTISGNNACLNMFDTCESLTSIDLSSLTTISGNYACLNMFVGCTSLTSIDLSSLASITGAFACSGMFDGCGSLESISFPALTSSSFGSTYTNQFGENMFALCDALTEIHFPSNVRSVIENLDGYSSNFGADNAEILFDLPATR